MGFALALTAPGVQRVVHNQSMFEHRMVVGKIGREAERQRQQTRRLRREIEACRVGSAHCHRQGVERRVADPIDPEKRVKAAELAVVRKRLGAGES